MMRIVLSLMFSVAVFVLSISGDVNAQNAGISLEEKLKQYEKRIEQLEKILGLKPVAPNQDSTVIGKKPIIIVNEELYKEKMKAVIDEYMVEKGKEEGTMLGGFKKKFFLKSADDSFKINLVGRVQLDWKNSRGVKEPVGGKPVDDDIFLRRARLAFEGHLDKYYEFKVQGDFAPENAELKDGFLNIHYWDELQFKFGQFKAPFGREELRSSKYIDFIERSMANDLLTPSRDYGIMAHGKLFDGVLSYAAGIFDGTRSNERDNNDEKDFATRLVLSPFKKWDSEWIKGLEFGANYTFGDQDRGSKSVRGRTAGDVDFFDRVAVEGERNRIGGDIAWYVGPASIVGEYIHVDEERQNLGPYIGGNQSNLDSLESDGWYLQGTYLLTGEKKGQKSISPKRPFDPKNGDWGALELAFRYGTVEFGANDLVGNRAEAFTYGLNWYLNKHVRFMVDWINNDMTHKLDGDGHWNTVLMRAQIIW